MMPGMPEKRSHDYLRPGTTTLFAALDIATGQVTAAVKSRHLHQEFQDCLKQVANANANANANPTANCIW
jgi:hypothetical protein